MNAKTLLRSVAVVSVLVLPVTVPVSAEVVFFVEGHGSPEASGHADFCQAVGDAAEQDFEDPALGQDFTVLPSLPIGDMELQLDCVLFDGTPFPPFLFTSPEFDVEGRVYHRALVVGTSMTIEPPAGQSLVAFGTWIFDDGGVLDSAYIAEVTETDGSVWEVILENDIPHNPYGHEIEGFVGVVSDVGISQITITSIDPETGETHPDGFEIDHVKAVAAALPPEEEEDDDDECRHRCHKRKCHGKKACRRCHGKHACKHARRHKHHHSHKSHSSGHADGHCRHAEDDSNSED
jgi:hypothetical protein